MRVCAYACSRVYGNSTAMAECRAQMLAAPGGERSNATEWGQMLRTGYGRLRGAAADLASYNNDHLLQYCVHHFNADDNHTILGAPLCVQQRVRVPAREHCWRPAFSYDQRGGSQRRA